MAMKVQGGALRPYEGGGRSEAVGGQLRAQEVLAAATDPMRKIKTALDDLQRVSSKLQDPQAQQTLQQLIGAFRQLAGRYSNLGGGKRYEL